MHRCPNYNDCKFVKDIPIDPATKEKYLSEYCTNDDTHWSQCKRYITKATLHFCPDFVLPDTPLTPEEIIEKFDNELF